jgi:exodeoxyribonuclease-3
MASEPSSKKASMTSSATEQPDVLCLQETKISDDLVDAFAFAVYPHLYWNCAEKKGYSGTALLCREHPSP